MSKLETNTIDTISGSTTLTLGGTNATDVTFGAGVKITNLVSTGIDDNATSTAITIDSSNNVGIGASSPQEYLSINVGLGTTEGLGLQYNNDTKGGIKLTPSTGEVSIGAFNTSGTYFTAFYSNNTERMRIDSSGGLGVGDTPFATTRLTLKAPASGNQYMVYGKNGAGTNVLIIAGDGSITNYYGSYGTISDENLKQNIVNANSQWNDIKSLQIKNYKLKSDVELNPETAPNLLGVIAQDLESSNMSGLVSVQNEVLWSENDELPEGVNVGDIKEPSHKSVKYSVLYMKAVKALQEAMERIETLEARITALENK